MKFKLFTRYSVEVEEGGMIGMRMPGWPLTLARILWRYWSDVGWRLKTKRDRRLTLGNALLVRLCAVQNRLRPPTEPQQ